MISDMVGKYAGVTKSKVSWLWYPYIPFGKITLIQGDPSEGKSMLAIKLASIASSAGRMPDGTTLGEPLRVIYQCVEDGISDTIIPRLELAGGKLSNFFFIKENENPACTLNRESIEYVLEKTKAKILIIDPIQIVLGRSLYTGEFGAVRNYMDMLAGVAYKTGCAIILIGHLNKNESGKELYRGSGSVDVVAAARSVLRVERIEEGSSVRVIRHIKSSLTQEGSDFAFEINSEKGISWIGMVDTPNESVDIAEQTRTERPTRKYDKVLKSLIKLLEKEDLPYSEVVEKTKSISGIRTLNEAKKELGIRSIKKADGWYWHLPEKG